MQLTHQPQISYERWFCVAPAHQQAAPSYVYRSLRSGELTHAESAQARAFPAFWPRAEAAMVAKLFRERQASPGPLWVAVPLRELLGDIANRQDRPLELSPLELGVLCDAKVDRRFRYAFDLKDDMRQDSALAPVLLKLVSWSQACSGCYEGYYPFESAGTGCSECGYRGRRAHRSWCPDTWD